MINSRSLIELETAFRELVKAWICDCNEVGLDILIVSTYRDDEYQNWLYASGRTRLGHIVTNARGGESKHNKRLAVDFCVMQGKTCDWKDVKSFTQAGIIAEKIGLVWAGRWNGKLKELGHIEAY